MNENPKGIWKKSRKGRSWLFAWLILWAATSAIDYVILIASASPMRGWPDWLGAAAFSLIAGAVVATIFICLWLFVRWLCSWKNFRRFLFVCACLATLIALAYAEEDWRGWYDLQKFKHHWEAKGEKFDWQSVVPAPVPDDQNFAMAPIWVESMKAILGPQNSPRWFGSYAEDGRTNFVNRLNIPAPQQEDDWPTNVNGNWQKATLTDLKPCQDFFRTLATRTNLFPVTSQPQTPAQDVLLALSKYDSTVEELRQAGERPDSRFPLDYNREDVWAILLPHLAVLKRCSQFLELRAVAELQNGQSDKALDDVKLSLRLIDLIHTEPFFISHLVRIAMLQITLQPIYEGLAEHQWSEAQLAELDSELAKLDFLADYQLALRGERGCEIHAVEYLQHRDRLHLNEITGDNLNGPLSFIPLLIYYSLPSGWFCQNELRICRFYETQYLPLVDETNRTVSPSAVRAAGFARRRESRHRTPENILELMLSPDFSAAVQKFAYAQESVDLARVAVALERYRMAMGMYPESLDALSPRFMDEIPHDIIGGQPLHYERTNDGQFILYSVGWNGRDDGGVVVFRKGGKVVDTDQGDWVWRYPAK